MSRADSSQRSSKGAKDAPKTRKHSKSDDTPRSKKDGKKGIKDWMKKMTFEISLQYNRMRYPTWNEVLLPNNFTTGVILGQLPDEEILNQLIQKHGVTSVVSCVEQFELDKFNLNFAARHVAQLTLPQQDFSRMDPRMLEDGANFLMKHLNVTSHSLYPPQRGPRSYVHCKAGRGRSTAVVVAYMLNLGFKVDGSASRMDRRLDILTCYDYVLKCRNHISCGIKKLEDIHCYYLRVRAREGIFLSFSGKERVAWAKSTSSACLKAIKVLRELNKAEAKLKERISKDLEKDAKSFAVFSAQQDLKNRRDELASTCATLKTEYDRFLSDAYFHYGSKVEKWLTDFYDRHNRKNMLEVQNIALLFSQSPEHLFDQLRKKYPDAAGELTPETLQKITSAAPEVNRSGFNLKNYQDRQKIANTVQLLCDKRESCPSYEWVKQELTREYGYEKFLAHKKIIQNVLNANFSKHAAKAKTSLAAAAAAPAAPPCPNVKTAACARPKLVIEKMPRGFNLADDHAPHDWTDRCDGSVSKFQILYDTGKMGPLPDYVFVRSATISTQRGMDVYFRISIGLISTR